MEEETQVEVKPMTELEKKREIERLDIIQRNIMAEEQSRVQAFMPELDALCKKYNCALIADVRMIGAGRNIEQTLNIGVRALSSEVPVDAPMSVEKVETETPTENEGE